jgi:hypothetical protein
MLIRKPAPASRAFVILGKRTRRRLLYNSPTTIPPEYRLSKHAVRATQASFFADRFHVFLNRPDGWQGSASQNPQEVLCGNPAVSFACVHRSPDLVSEVHSSPPIDLGLAS